jgi:hypothetical protein
MAVTTTTVYTRRLSCCPVSGELVCVSFDLVLLARSLTWLGPGARRGQHHFSARLMACSASLPSRFMQSWLLARTCEESGMPDAVATALGLSYASGFEVEFVGTDGVERRGPFLRCWDEPFEVALPIRSFPSFKGQKNFTGLYWEATSRSQVGYESWVERDAAMALDFDPAVVGLASQPFRLCWPQRDRQRTHTPDYFARLVNGTGVVIDVRPDDVVDEAAAEVFAVAAQVCGGGLAIPASRRSG